MSAPQSKQTKKLVNNRCCKRAKFANKADGRFYRQALTAAGPERLKLELERLCAQSVIVSTHDRTADNLAAIASHIDPIRRTDRYGVGTLVRTRFCVVDVKTLPGATAIEAK